MGRTPEASFAPKIKSGFRSACTTASASQLRTVNTSIIPPKNLDAVSPNEICACAASGAISRNRRRTATGNIFLEITRVFVLREKSIDYTLLYGKFVLSLCQPERRLRLQNFEEYASSPLGMTRFSDVLKENEGR